MFGDILLALVLIVALVGATLSGLVSNITQVVTVARNAGWEDNDLVIAVAVAMAESGGNAKAQGDYGLPTAGIYNAIGLWQVNIGENPQFANDNLSDPQVNANDAYAIWEQIGWNGWSTYKGGQYQQFLADAQNAVSGQTA